MQFACNNVQESTVALAARWMAEPSSLSSWLLVDGALLDDGKLALQLTRIGESVNALDLSPFAVFDDKAPRLLRVCDPSVVELDLARLIAIDRTAPAFSFFKSAASVDQLQRLFAYLAQTEVDGGLPLHCRFADTRVLPRLLRTLSPSQERSVGAVIDEWRWFTRCNGIDRWPGGGVGQSGVDSTRIDDRLRLSDAQFKTMLDASEADTIFTILLEKTPEVVAAEHRGEFHALLQRHLAAATARSVTQPPDRLQFAVLALTCGSDFHNHPGLEQTWKSIREDAASLVELMRSWDDRFWAEMEQSAQLIS